MADILGYLHLSLSVTDLLRSTEWYRALLGLEIESQTERTGFRRTRLRAPGSGVTLTLTSHHKQSGDAFSERRTGMDHVAFRLGTAADVEELRVRCVELGVDHSEVKVSGGGMVMMTLRDPDNIQLEVFGGAVAGG